MKSLKRKIVNYKALNVKDEPLYLNFSQQITLFPHRLYFEK